jgi:hypothetical protein
MKAFEASVQTPTARIAMPGSNCRFGGDLLAAISTHPNENIL